MKRRMMLRDEEIIDSNTVFLIKGDSISDSGIYKIPISNSGVVLSSQSKFGSSLYFNGSSQLTIAQLFSKWAPGSSNFTIDWWENIGSNQDRYGCIFSHDNYNYTSIVLGISQIAIGDAYGTWGFANYNAIRPVGIWQHIAVVRYNNVLSIYLNGRVVYQNNVTGMSVAINDTVVYMGRRKANGIYYIGYLESFRISNIARWASDFTPPIKL